MAIQKYRVTYKNRATQIIPADEFETQGSFVVFKESNRNVASLSASEVRSVVKDEMPTEEAPEVIMG